MAQSLVWSGLASPGGKGFTLGTATLFTSFVSVIVFGMAVTVPRVASACWAQDGRLSSTSAPK